ncbi:mntH [Symbiodinium microadriaticum]|nr:mntH [Symbiodinium microadriaticum]
MSDRECEGWVGMTYQHKEVDTPDFVSLPGTIPHVNLLKVQLHVRMCDDTAKAQGEAIGILGTNLVYLCNFARDPVVITSFLLDALEDGRLEVDFVEFSGPAFPEETVDYRLLAMKMVEFKVAASVLLLFDEAKQRYVQAVPNNAFYKRPIVVQRSRFRPVTYAHREVIQAAAKKLSSELGSDTKPVMEILDFQIDDIVRPRDYLGTEGRLRRTRAAVEADVDGDGILTVDNLAKVFAKKCGPQAEMLPEDEALQLAKDLDVDGGGKVVLDQAFPERCANNVEFLDRFKCALLCGSLSACVDIRMLQALKLPVLASWSDSQLSSYLGRYTNAPIVLAASIAALLLMFSGGVGGGNYDIGRGIFQEKNYSTYKGGMLEATGCELKGAVDPNYDHAFGKLFAGNVRMFQYPNISPWLRIEHLLGSAAQAVTCPEGEVSENVEFSAGSTEYLHRFLVEQEKIVQASENVLTEAVSIEPTYMNSFAVSKESNEPYRGQSEETA